MNNNNPVMILETGNLRSMEAFRQILEEVLKPVVEELMDKVPEKKPRLTTHEVCEEYDVCRETLQVYHRQGLAYQKGKPNWYYRKDIEAFFESRKIQYRL